MTETMTARAVEAFAEKIKIMTSVVEESLVEGAGGFMPPRGGAFNPPDSVFCINATGHRALIDLLPPLHPARINDLVNREIAHWIAPLLPPCAVYG